jgi:hypothetical protein
VQQRRCTSEAFAALPLEAPQGQPLSQHSPA